MTDLVKFHHLIDQLKQLKLTEEKLFLLQQADLWVVDGKQLVQIISCFTHSADKSDVVHLLQKRICPQIPVALAADALRCCSLSKDRLQVLRILVGKLSNLQDEEAQKRLLLEFDSVDDRQQAWTLIDEQCSKLTGTSSRRPDLEERPELDLNEVNNTVKCIATAQKEHATVFDLPIMRELHYVSSIPDVRARVNEAVEKRRSSGLDFLIPSNVWHISNSLRPGSYYCREERKNNALTTAPTSTTAYGCAVSESSCSSEAEDSLSSTDHEHTVCRPERIQVVPKLSQAVNDPQQPFKNCFSLVQDGFQVIRNQSATRTLAYAT